MNITDKILADVTGGTVSLEGRNLPTTGYFVGGIVAALIVGEEPERVEIDSFIAYLTDRIGADYVGWWTDGETGQLYIDGTTWHADYDEAERLCRERGEIALWSIADQREFRPVVLADKEV